MAHLKILQKNIEYIIQNSCKQFDFDPLEIKFVKENNQLILKIFIFSSSRDISIDDCANLTKILNNSNLDEIIKDKYILEVSSPGLTRILASKKEYNIFKNRKVILKTKNNFVVKNYTISAILLGLDENKDVVTFKSLEDGKIFDILFCDIKSTQLEL